VVEPPRRSRRMQGLPPEEPKNTTSEDTNVEITQPEIVTETVEGSEVNQPETTRIEEPNFENTEPELVEPEVTQDYEVEILHSPSFRLNTLTF
jgi:hypothetical protein